MPSRHNERSVLAIRNLKLVNQEGWQPHSLRRLLPPKPRPKNAEVIGEPFDVFGRRAKDEVSGGNRHHFTGSRVALRLVAGSLSVSGARKQSEQHGSRTPRAQLQRGPGHAGVAALLRPGHDEVRRHLANGDRLPNLVSGRVNNAHIVRELIADVRLSAILAENPGMRSSSDRDLPNLLE